MLLQGLTLALVMGLIEGLFPALRAIRLNTATALRAQQLSCAGRFEVRVPLVPWTNGDEMMNEGRCEIQFSPLLLQS